MSHDFNETEVKNLDLNDVNTNEPASFIDKWNSTYN